LTLIRIRFFESLDGKEIEYLGTLSERCDLLITAQKLKPPVEELAALVGYTRRSDGY
jgi:hypothetical protein